MSVIQEYINQQPDNQDRLNEIYQTIKELLPQASEKIAWGMPTFYQNGQNVIHFAYNKHHVGLYPSPTPIVYFAKRLESYKTSKGAIQLANNQDLDLELIKDIVNYRKQELDIK